MIRVKRRRNTIDIATRFVDRILLLHENEGVVEDTPEGVLNQKIK